MPKPHFIFTRRKNSFSVHIPNLEELHVNDIQEIETFVANRKGIFDFNTYTFVIPKKIEFQEFVALLESLNFDAECSENRLIEASKNNTVSFGQYKGMLYTDLPDVYLIWLQNNYRGRDLKRIQQEIQNRNL